MSAPLCIAVSRNPYSAMPDLAPLTTVGNLVSTLHSCYATVVDSGPAFSPSLRRLRRRHHLRRKCVSSTSNVRAVSDYLAQWGSQTPSCRARRRNGRWSDDTPPNAYSACKSPAANPPSSSQLLRPSARYALGTSISWTSTAGAQSTLYTRPAAAPRVSANCAATEPS